MKKLLIILALAFAGAVYANTDTYYTGSKNRGGIKKHYRLTAMNEIPAKEAFKQEAPKPAGLPPIGGDIHAAIEKERDALKTELATLKQQYNELMTRANATITALERQRNELANQVVNGQATLAVVQQQLDATKATAK